MGFDAQRYLQTRALQDQADALQDQADALHDQANTLGDIAAMQALKLGSDAANAQFVADAVRDLTDIERKRLAIDKQRLDLEARARLQQENPAAFAELLQYEAKQREAAQIAHAATLRRQQMLAEEARRKADAEAARLRDRRERMRRRFLSVVRSPWTVPVHGFQRLYSLSGVANAHCRAVAVITYIAVLVTSTVLVLLLTRL